MRNPSMQRNLPPMEVSRVDSPDRAGNSGDTASVQRVASIDLVTVALAAARRLNHYDKELADIFTLSPSLFSKSFDPNNDTHNRPMKATLPKEYAEAFVRTMAEMLGLRIGGTEQQTRAFADLMDACARVIRSGQL